jgi:hypothetical protein
MHPRYLQKSQGITRRTPSQRALHACGPTPILSHGPVSAVLTVLTLKPHDRRRMRPGNERLNVCMTCGLGWRGLGKGGA